MAAFVDGGNTFVSGTGTLGTNNASTLNVRTNGSNAITIGLTQIVTVPQHLEVFRTLSIGANTITGQLLLRASNGGAITITVPNTLPGGTYTLILPASQSIASQTSVLANDGTGALTWLNTNNSSNGLFVQGGNRFGQIAILGTTNNFGISMIANGVSVVAINTDKSVQIFGPVVVGGSDSILGSIGMKSGNGLATFTQTVNPSMSISYTVRWPPAQATGLGTISLLYNTGDGLGTLAWMNLNGSSSILFRQLGNSFGTNAVLGTNDSFSLSLITNSISALTINTSQVVSIRSALIVGTASVGSGTLTLQSNAGGSLTQTVNSGMNSSYSITWPSTQSSAGIPSALTNNGTGTLSWTPVITNSFVQSGNAFGATATLGTNDNFSLFIKTNNINAILVDMSQSVYIAKPLTIGSQNAGVGVLNIANSPGSGAVSQTVPSNMSGFYTIIWPESQATAGGQVLTNNGSGTLSWVSPFVNNSVFLNGGNSFGGTATLGTNDNSNLVIKTNNISAILIDTNQIVYITKTLTLGSQNAGVGVLNIANSSGGGAITQTVPSNIIGFYTIIWPGSQATASGQVLTNNGSGTLSWMSPATNSNAFLNGGNSFGSTATLGTNDNFALFIKTNNTNAILIDASQSIYIMKNLTVGTQGQGVGSISIGPNTATGSITQTVPSNMSGFYTIIWPGTQATANGQVLTNDGSGTLSWVTPVGLDNIVNNAFVNGGNTFGGTANLGLKDNFTLNFIVNNTTIISCQEFAVDVFGLFRVGGLTSSGVISISSPSGGVLNMTVPQNMSTTYTIVWPDTQALEQSILTNDGSGTLTWMAPDAAGSMFINNGNSFGVTAVLGTNDNNNLVFKVNNTAVIAIGTNGITSINSVIVVTNTIQIGVNTTGRLILGSFTGGAIFITVPQNMSNIYTVIWPGTQATAGGQVLTNDGSGTLSWASPSANSNSFINGGNTFGVPAVLGTNDNQTLTFKVNNISVMTFATNGTISISNIVNVNNTIQIGQTGISNGNFVLKSVAGGGLTMTVSSSMTQSNTIIWPSTSPTPGQVLTNVSGGTLAWTTPAAFNNSFIQGGNTFGVPAVLGTNDPFDLLLITYNQLAMTIRVNKTVEMYNTLNVANSIRVGGVGGLTGKFILQVRSSATVGSLTMTVPDNMSGSYEIVWPGVQNAGTLTNNGLGVLSWSPAWNVGGNISDGSGNMSIGINGSSVTTLEIKNGSTAILIEPGVTGVVTCVRPLVVGQLISGVSGSLRGSITLKDPGSGIGITQLAAENMPSNYTIVWPRFSSIGSTNSVLTDVNGDGILEWKPINLISRPHIIFERNFTRWSNGGPSFQVTNLQASITPILQNSLIKITVYGSLKTTNSDAFGCVGLVRLIAPITFTPLTGLNGFKVVKGEITEDVNFIYIDSAILSPPGPIIYAVTLRRQSGGSGNAIWNDSEACVTMTLEEIYQ